jgi:hypothetical protein
MQQRNRLHNSAGCSLRFALSAEPRILSRLQGAGSAMAAK